MNIQNTKALPLARITVQVQQQVNSFLDYASAHPQTYSE